MAQHIHMLLVSWVKKISRLQDMQHHKFDFKTALMQDCSHWYFENKGIEYKMRMQKGQHKTKINV